MPEAPMLRFNPNRPGMSPVSTINPQTGAAAMGSIPPAMSMPNLGSDGLAQGIANAGASIGDAFEKVRRKKEERKERQREAHITALGGRLTQINSTVESKRKLLTGIYSTMASRPDWIADPKFEPLIRTLGLHNSKLDEEGFQAQDAVLDALVSYEKDRDLKHLDAAHAIVKNKLAAVRGDPDATWNIVDENGKTDPDRFLSASSAMTLTDLSYHVMKMAAEHQLDVRYLKGQADNVSQRAKLHRQAADGVLLQMAGAEGDDSGGAVSSMYGVARAVTDMLKSPTVSRNSWDALEEVFTRTGSQGEIPKTYVRHLRNVFSEESLKDRKNPISTQDPAVMGVHVYLSHLLIPTLRRMLGSARGEAGTSEPIGAALTNGAALKVTLPADLVDMGKSLKGKQVGELQDMLASMMRLNAALSQSDAVTSSLVQSYFQREKNPLYQVEALLQDLGTVTPELLTSAYAETLRSNPDFAYVGSFMADLPSMKRTFEPMDIGAEEEQVQELVGPPEPQMPVGPPSP